MQSSQFSEMPHLHRLVLLSAINNNRNVYCNWSLFSIQQRGWSIAQSINQMMMIKSWSIKTRKGRKAYWKLGLLTYAILSLRFNLRLSHAGGPRLVLWHDPWMLLHFIPLNLMVVFANHYMVLGSTLKCKTFCHYCMVLSYYLKPN